MDTREILKFALSHKKIKKHFAGVFPCNHLPNKKLTKFPQYFIVNSCTVSRNKKIKRKVASDEWKLCHWMSLAVFQNKIFYFDSSGYPPNANKFISRFMKKQRKPVHYLTITIQSENSSLCGLFSLLFLHFISNSLGLKQYLLKFKTDPQLLEENDAIVLRMFKSYFLPKNK